MVHQKTLTYFNYIDCNSTEIYPKLEWPGYTYNSSSDSSPATAQPTQLVTEAEAAEVAVGHGNARD
jgi:hypothetical protein